MHGNGTVHLESIHKSSLARLSRKEKRDWECVTPLTTETLKLDVSLQNLSPLTTMPDPRKILFIFASLFATAYGHLHGAVPQEFLDDPDKDISHLDEEMRMRITHAR